MLLTTSHHEHNGSDSSSTSSNLSCSSFSIRKGNKAKPPPDVINTVKDDQSKTSGFRQNRICGGRVSAGNSEACEKINANSFADSAIQRTCPSASDTDPQTNHEDHVEKKTPSPPSCTTTSAPVSVVVESTPSSVPAERSERSDKIKSEYSEGGFEPSDNSNEDVADCSMEVVGVANLADEEQPGLKPVQQVPESSSPAVHRSNESFANGSVDRNNGSDVAPPSSKSTIKHKPALKSSLKSSRFSGGSKKQLHVARPTTERRVRGLWTGTVEENCYFTKLRDETVAHICGFLNLAETLKVSMVAKRYHSLVHSNKQLWRSVDATEFVQIAHTHFLSKSNGSATKAQEQTGQALEKVLQKHSPITLKIGNIHNRLSADSYLPSVASLQELTLTHFEDLADTHVHVLLLMTLAGAVAAAKKRSNSLRKLVLNHCPRLKDASVRSIAIQCPSLEVLSLQGCVGITNLDPLAPLFTLESKPASLSSNMGAAPAPAQASMLKNMFKPPASKAVAKPGPKPSGCKPQGASLTKLFAPPSKPERASKPTLSNMFTPPPKQTSLKPAPAPSASGGASSLSGMFAPPSAEKTTAAASTAISPLRPSTPPNSPPRDTSPTSTSSLQSLFAPPGMTPPRNENAPAVPNLKTSDRGLGHPSVNGGSGGGGAAAARHGKLQELDLQGTGINPAAQLKLFQTISGGKFLISLKSLHLDGNQWNDGHLNQLGGLLVWNQLSQLSLECSTLQTKGGTTLTDDALIRLTNSAVRFSKLTSLNLSGQKKVTGRGVSKLVQQCPKLSTLTCQRMPHLLADTSVAPLMKGLETLHKKGVLRLVDFRQCDLDPLVKELVQSTLTSETSDTTTTTTTANKPIQLLL